MSRNVSPEMQKLLSKQEKALAKMRDNKNQLNALKAEIAERDRHEHDRHLRALGECVEKHLIEPELFSTEEVISLLDFLFMSNYMHGLIRKMTAIGHGEMSGSIEALIKNEVDRQRAKDAASGTTDTTQYQER